MMKNYESLNSLMSRVLRECRGSTIRWRKPLPRDLSTVPHPQLSTMSFPGSNIKNLDHLLDALLRGNSGLLKAKQNSAVITHIGLNPCAPS